MPPYPSAPQTLCLHAVRILGGKDGPRIAARFHLDRDEVNEMLLDFEALGWTSRTGFGSTRAWSLTDAGRVEDERRLSIELDDSGTREVVTHAHESFVPLNARFLQAATDWQLRPMPGAPLAQNDHTDFRWDDRVIERLTSIGRRLEPITNQLSGALSRFDGYAPRYATAADQVQSGHVRWVDSIEIDSCHVVWMQLHEDLIATLGLQRGGSS